MKTPGTLNKRPRDFWLKDIDVCWVVFNSKEEADKPALRLGTKELVHVREVLPESKKVLNYKSLKECLKLDLSRLVIERATHKVGSKQWKYYLGKIQQTNIILKLIEKGYK